MCIPRTKCVGGKLNIQWPFALSWIQRFLTSMFFFFFFSHVNSNFTWVHCAETKITIHALFITVHNTVYILKNIKNGSHGTIHTFKNYFATVLSVFSFQFSVSATINSIQTDPHCEWHQSSSASTRLLSHPQHHLPQ